MGCSEWRTHGHSKNGLLRSGAEVIEVGGGHAVFLRAGSPLSAAGIWAFMGRLWEMTGAWSDFSRDRGSTTQIEVASLADPSLLAALSAHAAISLPNRPTRSSAR